MKEASAPDHVKETPCWIIRSQKNVLNEIKTQTVDEMLSQMSYIYIYLKKNKQTTTLCVLHVEGSILKTQRDNEGG